LTEREGFFNQLPRHGRSDGWGGYDAGHAERHVAHEAMHFFKHLAERIKDVQQTGGCEKLLIGCRDETWPEIEPHLHPYSRQRLVGHFAIDPATANAEQVRAHTERMLREEQNSYREGLIREVTGEAGRNGRGSLGLRRVLRSLETGEVQTLLLGHNFSSKGVECPNCGHLDSHLVKNCALCGHETRELEDVSNALIRIAMRDGIEIVYVTEPEFEKVGNIAALLRFRADQNKMERLAV
jgi:peptide subunit release factor 1 (eRF1)